MNIKATSIGSLVLAALVMSGCENVDRETRDSATVGAATGAVIGGIIGHESGETGLGAATGAAVGGAAGAAYEELGDDDEVVDVDRRFTDEDYMSLLTDEEEDILRARAAESDRRDYELADFLTAEERENLRRRADRLAERRADERIGS